MKFVKVASLFGSVYYINLACIEAVGLDHNGQTKIYMRGDNYFTDTSVEDIVRMASGDEKDWRENEEIDREISALKDRAERAEAALVEAQERALKFERMLIAEEARKDAEPVLDKYRVLRTAMDISSQNTRTKSIAILSYHSIRLFLLEICGVTYTENVYRWK